MTPKELVNEIAKKMYTKFPLVMEYETDSRDVWPARVQFLLDIIETFMNRMAREYGLRH